MPGWNLEATKHGGRGGEDSATGGGPARLVGSRLLALAKEVCGGFWPRPDAPRDKWNVATCQGFTYVPSAPTATATATAVEFITVDVTSRKARRP